MSIVNRYEIGCKRSSIRSLHVYAFSEAFASGRAVAANTDPDKESYVPAPNSIGEPLVKFVCKKSACSRIRKT